MTTQHQITTEKISIRTIGQLLNQDVQLELSDEVIARIEKCRTYLDNKVSASLGPVYGINTGFGSLYSQSIDDEDLHKLQDNIVKSHACGFGEEVPKEIVKLMIFLKIQSLGYGHSGVQKVTVDRLVDFYNHGVTPIVYEMGSLGASGDLAPLAHLSLPLIGEGEVQYRGEKISGKEINRQLGWDLVSLTSKEGLALLNGTQLMSAYGTWAVYHAQRILTLANTIGALSLDAFDGRIEPFNALVHQIRPQKGQQAVAAHVLGLLEASALIKAPKKHVQDPYSFRCIPQVHGASFDAIAYVKNIMEIEINSVTDNPNVFPDEDLIISAGNFHGQPLALSLDFLTLALSELGSISERRTYQLISGERELPNYLVANPGLNSGLMIPQYTAASIASQNKQYCAPASADSIVSSNGQEDHVSMGANAATKTYKVVNNLYRILAIELITAAQAMDFRKGGKTSPYLEKFMENFRKVVPFIEYDRLLHTDMVEAETFLKQVAIDEIEI